LISLIAIGLPDREALVSSPAPLATLYESVTGHSGKPISAMASIAMVNGILVQLVMASRVIYGMTREGLAPKVLGQLNQKRQTPIRAIVLVTVLIAMLALAIPLLKLAQATSLVTLTVFLLVNIALWRIGGQGDADPMLKKWRAWGILGALLSGGLLFTEIARLATTSL
jgi:amino acid transporter